MTFSYTKNYVFILGGLFEKESRASYFIGTVLPMCLRFESRYNTLLFYLKQILSSYFPQEHVLN